MGMKLVLMEEHALRGWRTRCFGEYFTERGINVKGDEDNFIMYEVVTLTLCYIPRSFIMETKSRMMEWEEHVARTEEMMYVHKC
jgi:hypothetical protein